MDVLKNIFQRRGAPARPASWIDEGTKLSSEHDPNGHPQHEGHHNRRQRFSMSSMSAIFKSRTLSVKRRTLPNDMIDIQLPVEVADGAVIEDALHDYPHACCTTSAILPSSRNTTAQSSKRSSTILKLGSHFFTKPAGHSDSNPIVMVQPQLQPAQKLQVSSFSHHTHEPGPKVALERPNPIQNSGQGGRSCELASIIARETAKVEAYMAAKGQAMPGFARGDPDDFPALPYSVHTSRMAVIEAAAELKRLMHGPRETVRWMAWGFLDVLALQIVNHYQLASLVPPDGTISLSKLAAQTRLDTVNVARVLRYAMTTGLFLEPKAGEIAHSPASLALRDTNSTMVDWIGFNTEEIFPAAGHVLDALTRFPEATSLLRTGFNVAAGTVDKEPMFATFDRHSSRARRMGRAMESLTTGEGYELSYLLDAFGDGDREDHDWVTSSNACTTNSAVTSDASNGTYGVTSRSHADIGVSTWHGDGELFGLREIDARSGTFVDVGGSHGFVCVELAKRYRNMRFVVQDLPKTVGTTPRPLSPDAQIDSRIELMSHDFFTEQPVKNADVYFFRWILHNYSTPYAIQMLRNLVPALKPGARIIINDHCLRTPGSETPWDERIIRGMDMVMLTLLNAQERDEKEFEALFREAHEGFVFRGVQRRPGCRMGIIEAVWKQV